MISSLREPAPAPQVWSNEEQRNGPEEQWDHDEPKNGESPLPLNLHDPCQEIQGSDAAARKAEDGQRC